MIVEKEHKQRVNKFKIYNFEGDSSMGFGHKYINKFSSKNFYILVSYSKSAFINYMVKGKVVPVLN
jgi:hypothetical protein